MSTAKKLTKRQEAFVYEYLIDLNGTQAALRAGYTGNPVTLSAVASENLRKPLIREAIRIGIEAKTEERLLVAARIKEEVGRLAFSDMKDFVDWGPNGVKLTPSKKLGANTRCVQEVRETTTTVKGVTERQLSFRLHDKIGSLDRLAKLHGLYADNQINVNVAFVKQVVGVREEDI
jgi:phage terminase small subunit